LEEEFKDVGLMTGDMTINPNATCLIMTTEILRSMLYRGSEVMREVAWIIYDEVHYMRDKERGVVWEESIILLPHNVRFVFLSATIPNSKEFCAWVSKIHNQPCGAVYTDYRPTPLEHFLYPAGASGLYLTVDRKGHFREDSFQKAMSALRVEDELGGSSGKKGRGGKRQTGGKNQVAADLFKIVKLIMERDLDPCIVFSFSKKDCETYALQMSKLDFNSEEEKALVVQVYDNALESLGEEDRALPQVVSILPLIKRGIGIHHGGLLPILKEVLEILFQEGLIKCLFATETFSIGINMPAKTVVFTSTRKFDGDDFRWISSGEYIQMSGRAGRRGKDDRGIVIQMLDEKMEPEVTKAMIYGASDPLNSSYHVSYNMVLNMLRVEDADPEHLLRSSFHQFQQEQSAPALEAKAAELQAEAAAVTLPGAEGAEAEEQVGTYHSALEQQAHTHREMARTMHLPQHCVPFLQAGRLVRVQCAEQDWGWGALVSSKKVVRPRQARAFAALDSVLGYEDAPSKEEEGEVTVHVLDVLLHVAKAPAAGAAGAGEGGSRTSSFTRRTGLVPSLGQGQGQVAVLQVALAALHTISAVRLNLPRDLGTESARAGVLKAVASVPSRFAAKGEPVPLLDPAVDMGISDPAFLVLARQHGALSRAVETHPLHRAPHRDGALSALRDKLRLLEGVRACQREARASQAVAMREELRKRRKVLRALGYVSAEGVLSSKGRFCCELSTADELVVTDMVFDGSFNDLTVAQAVALLSCFVHKEAAKEGASKLPGPLQAPFERLQNVARNVAKASVDAGLQLDEGDFVSAFNPGMMEVCAAWATGARFIDVCAMTDIFEGSLIRNIRRLEELLRQLASAALAIGNNELKALFEQGADQIRRGVVFAASLYI
jgi:ATP-dependent RNA helicase DOB1